MHVSWASVGTAPCACVYYTYTCVFVSVCVRVCGWVYTQLRTSVHVCVCVHVSLISEMEAETAAIPLLLLRLCFPRQIVSHALGAELQTASWLLRLMEGIFKQSFYLSNPCYFVESILQPK